MKQKSCISYICCHSQMHCPRSPRSYVRKRVRWGAPCCNHYWNNDHYWNNYFNSGCIVMFSLKCILNHYWNNYFNSGRYFNSGCNSAMYITKKNYELSIAELNCNMTVMTKSWIMELFNKRSHKFTNNKQYFGQLIYNILVLHKFLN